MSNTPHPLARFFACDRKRWHFAEQADAEEHALHIYQQTGTALGVYLCRFCQHYHLGHKPLTRHEQRRRARKKYLARMENMNERRS